MIHSSSKHTRSEKRSRSRREREIDIDIDDDRIESFDIDCRAELDFDLERDVDEPSDFATVSKSNTDETDSALVLSANPRGTRRALW